MLNLYKTSIDATTYIKRIFEDEYGGKWNAVVGRNVSTSVQDDSDEYIHAEVDRLNTMDNKFNLALIPSLK